jgi:Flp pilus assembly protein CpaB
MEHAQKLFSTRGGTLVLAGSAALLAAIAVFVYVHNYLDSVKQGGTAASVMVAGSLIPKGTPGDSVATKHLFQVQAIRESQLREGALSDPASLRDRVAATDIFPGQQLTSADFTTSSGTLASTLSGRERAITIPIDGSRGMIGNLHAGDRVDIYAGFNVAGHAVLRLIMQNIAVADVATGSQFGGSSSTQVVLRATSVQASNLAFTSDNGRIWLVLRPPTGGKASPPNLVTAETLILGTPAIKLLRTPGGR